MCTYNLTLNDTLVESAEKMFPSQMAITSWMQQQLERMLRQVVGVEPMSKTVKEVKVTDRIQSLSAVPPCSHDADYKDELASLMAEKY